MVKRLLPFAIVLSALAAGGVSHACGGNGGALVEHAEIRAVATDPTVRMVAWEEQTFEICDTGPGDLGAVTAQLTIYRNGQIVCTLSEASGVNVGVDPFGFGAGLHLKDDALPCDVGVSAASIENPLTPQPTESGLQGNGVGVALGKTVLAQHDTGEDQRHGIRIGDEIFEVADPAAFFMRKVILKQA